MQHTKQNTDERYALFCYTDIPGENTTNAVDNWGAYKLRTMPEHEIVQTG